MVKLSFSFRESRINLNTMVFRVNITTLTEAIRKSFVSPAFLTGSIHLHESQRYSVWNILRLTRNG